MFSGIDLENIVYYKDNTHYFVMTAKKQSLLDKGVILNVSFLLYIMLIMCFNQMFKIAILSKSPSILTCYAKGCLWC